MNNIETQYLELLQDVLDNGDPRQDRTGVGTLSVFGRQIRQDLSKGFPLLTTKKTAWKPIIGELLWFVEGSNDERRLAEITFGTRDAIKKTIWTANATSEYWKNNAKFEGDLGRIYGVQWRRWKSRDGEIDQLQNIVNTIKTNPADRRMVMTAFNVGEIEEMALPPCHMFCQFHVNMASSKLNCQVYMRSVDLALGLPFNIASYAALVHMLSKVTHLDPGELIMSLGDCHIYKNHVDGIKQQLQRDQLDFPRLNISGNQSSIDDFSMKDFEIVGYKSHETIKFPMAV